MKKILFVFIIATVCIQAVSQPLESFEKITLDSGKVLNGSQGETQYKFDLGNSNLVLPVTWDTSWGGLWTAGWALSRKQDSITMASSAGKHLYCAKPYTGVSNSKTYAVGQNGSFLFTEKLNNYRNNIAEFYISNCTYAYNSMKLGDFFGKKFGGKNGNDSDYFFCRIKTYQNGAFLDSQDVYLADFRFANNANDYILSSWKKVITSAATDSVGFHLYSSDNGQYGMNTPGFFVLDDIGIVGFDNINKAVGKELAIYPNPAQKFVQIESKIPIFDVAVYGITGSLLGVVNAGGSLDCALNLQNLENGIYTLKLRTTEGIINKKLVIQK